MRTHSIGDMTFALSEPVTDPVHWIGQEELLEQILEIGRASCRERVYVLV